MSETQRGLDSVERRIQEELGARQSELEDRLAELVAIPTGMGHADGLETTRALLVERLQAIGATTTLEQGDSRPDWLLGKWPNQLSPPSAVCFHDGPGPRILMAGHLDTVHDPEGSFQTLEHEPDGISRGPGAADMKGGLLVIVAALEALAFANVDTNWTVLLTSDEETGSFCSERHLREAARQADIGLVVEPALPDGSLVIERMGSGQFMIEVEGRSAHVGREFERGISAVKALAEVMLEILALADPARGRIVNIGPIEGGAATNAVPDHAACWGNVRFADPEAQAALAAEFDRIEHRWAHDDHGKPHPPEHHPRIRIERTFNRPAKPLTPAVEQLAQAARHAAEALGQALPFAKTGGVCDGNVLQDEGLPVIDTLGVRGGNLHRLDEFVELPSLSERAALLAILIKRLAAGEEQIASDRV